MKLDPYLIPLTKISSKCVKDLSVTPETRKLLEESRGNKLLDMRLGNDFGGYQTKSTWYKSTNR